jgi:hypothetical protein
MADNILTTTQPAGSRTQVTRSDGGSLDVEIMAPNFAPGTISASAVPFAFNTASPLVLSSLAGGARIVRAAIVVSTPFDAGAATLSLGTPGSPALVLGPTDNTPGAAAQYETDQITTIGAPDTLQLAISPGASTQGAGFVFFETI